MATIVTTFTTINGMLIHEDRGGVETEYVSDPLGSLVQTRNSSGTKTYEAEYWPYGELQASTGTNPSSWGYVGLLGYLIDSATMLYVRARYLMTKFARWLTVDPLWPYEKKYVCVENEPTKRSDASGLLGPIVIAILLALATCMLFFLIGGLSSKSLKEICEQCLDVFVGTIFGIIILLIGTGLGLGALALMIAEAWGITLIEAQGIVATLFGGLGAGISWAWLHDLCNPAVGGRNQCGDFDRGIPAGRLIRVGNQNFAG